MSQLSLFDYSQLDVETRSFVETCTSEIRALARRSAQDIIEIGQKLAEVKARVGHGNFGAWLESEFGWQWKTANNFMRVADKFVNFTNLDSFAPSALYLLASPSAPESAVEEAMSLATTSHQVTHKEAREIVSRHKDPASIPCQDCGEIFDRQVWHCPYCDHHWSDNRTDCANCSNKRPSKRTAQDVYDLAERSPELFEQVKSGSVTIPQAKKKIQRQEKEDRKAAIPDDLPTENERYRLICSDALDMTRHVEPGSVDHIITDPPYPKDYLSVYEDLARFAAHALRPGGNLLVMVGQSYLPEILQLMTPHIQYHWTLAYLTPGGQSPQIWQRKVNTFWKPVLWFVKGDYTGDWIGDVAKSDPNHNDKRFHHWGQSESGMADLIERLTYPGQTICDPFLGGGTTAIVSVAMNRLFIGSDVDNDAIKITLERLQDGGNRINARHVSCL